VPNYFLNAANACLNDATDRFRDFTTGKNPAARTSPSQKSSLRTRSIGSGHTVSVAVPTTGATTATKSEMVRSRSRADSPPNTGDGGSSNQADNGVQPVPPVREASGAPPLPPRPIMAQKLKEYMLEKGYDDVRGTRGGMTLLHHICVDSLTNRSMATLVWQLLPHVGAYYVDLPCGAEARQVGWTALHLTCNNKDVAGIRRGIIRRLLDAQADPEVARPNGATAIHTAVGCHFHGAIEVLLQAGADVEHRVDGRSCRDIAWNNRVTRDLLKGIGVTRTPGYTGGTGRSPHAQSAR
jgi:hypothetical protein